jgi:hypothetical protein
VESKQDIYDLAARFVVHGWFNMQLTHTLDHEGSARHLALMSALVSSFQEGLSPPIKFADFNRKFRKDSESHTKEEFNNRIFLGVFNQCQDREEARAVASAVTSRFCSDEELQAEYNAANTESARTGLLKPLLSLIPRFTDMQTERLSESVFNILHPNKKLSAKDSGAAAAGSSEMRRVYISGPLSSVFREHAGESTVIFEKDAGQELGQAGRETVQQWANLQVRDGPKSSHNFRVFVIRGETVLDCIESVHEPTDSDWDVASNAALILLDILPPSERTSERNNTREVLLFESVAAEVRKRCRGQLSDNLSPSLRVRLGDLAELLIAKIQYKYHGHVINFHEAKSAKSFLWSLILVSRDEAFLYFDKRKAQRTEQCQRKTISGGNKAQYRSKPVDEIDLTGESQESARPGSPEVIVLDD